MSESNQRYTIRTPVTVNAAIDALAVAIEELSADTSNSKWPNLYKTLLPFKDPLDGGSFSTADLAEFFFAIISSDVMTNVYRLKDVEPNQWNSHAIEAASCVWIRITDIIACLEEVNEKCRLECGSPTHRRPLSPIPKCK